MADNLSVSVTADTSELRAQLALAQADLRAFGAETRKLASDIRSGGDAGGVLRGQLERKGLLDRAGIVDTLRQVKDQVEAQEGAATQRSAVAELMLQALDMPVAGAQARARLRLVD